MREQDAVPMRVEQRRHAVGHDIRIEWARVWRHGPEELIQASGLSENWTPGKRSGQVPRRNWLKPRHKNRLSKPSRPSAVLSQVLKDWPAPVQHHQRQRPRVSVLGRTRGRNAAIARAQVRLVARQSFV